MVKDLFQLDFVISADLKMEIMENVHKLGIGHPYCSACSSGVDVVFMRKTPEESTNQCMCVPCFLRNHTDASDEDIDRMVALGESQGYYKD